MDASRALLYLDYTMLQYTVRVLASFPEPLLWYVPMTLAVVVS
jgi:hypothetical protein